MNGHNQQDQSNQSNQPNQPNRRKKKKKTTTQPNSRLTVQLVTCYQGSGYRTAVVVFFAVERKSAFASLCQQTTCKRIYIYI
ncbi:hypothetical protein Glove_226g38 [Diversispora epigaea]|uniref:Uncharacterized protein n=1 Tax=Diversispora epigaea TaxID=1348612 RepID=A0A397IEM9_9GLOM|nr:hypothetical protein Glove_226g38 [Diversispora epigaea]